MRAVPVPPMLLAPSILVTSVGMNLLTSRIVRKNENRMTGARILPS